MESIGQVTALKGQVTAESEAGTRTLIQGGHVYAHEELVTGPNANIEVRFNDDTLLSQGPDARLTLDDYVFDPSGPSAASLILKMTQGVFRMVTGKIADQNPEAVKISSPLATLGIRGTGVDFDISPHGEKYGVFSYDAHDLVITTSQGTRFITQAGYMLDVSSDGSLGLSRPYTPDETIRFQQVAPISAVSTLDQGEDGPDSGGEDEDQGEDQGEGEGEDLGEEEVLPEDEILLEDEELEGEEEVPLDELGPDEPESEEFVDELADFVGEMDPEDMMDTEEMMGLDDMMDTNDIFGPGLDPWGEFDTASVPGFIPEFSPAEFDESILNDLFGSDEDDDDYGEGPGGEDLVGYLMSLNWIHGNDADNNLNGGVDPDGIIGYVGDDLLCGGPGDDLLVGDDPPWDNRGYDPANSYDDTLYGQDGEDNFKSGPGADLYIGGDFGSYVDTESDFITYDYEGWDETQTALQGVSVDLKVGTGTFNDRDGNPHANIEYGLATDEFTFADTLIGIDDVEGSFRMDTLIGNDSENEFMGFEGADSMAGEGGSDFINGDDGNDVLYGGAAAVGSVDSGFDHIFGGLGDDTIRGGDEVGGDNTGNMFGSDVEGDGTMVTGLGGTVDVGENVFDRNNDASTFVDLSSIFSNGINFYGQTYTGLYINNNGNLSFGSAFSDYQPYPLSEVTTPLIAGFWGDVDTRAVPGSVDENLVYYDLNTTDNVFTVTWYNVGYYSQHLDHVNAFQIQLFDQGGGDFNVVFRYDDVTWAGDEQHAARAGFSDGDGTSWELDGSGLENDMLDIDDRGGNNGKEGLWYFEFQGGNLVVGAPPNCDELGGGPGNDTIYGEAGNDLIGGHEGDDWLYGGDDNDMVHGDTGGDTILGDAGDDTLGGGDDDDSLCGGDGTDALYGNDGDDTLYGEAGTDELFGDADADTLDGGSGSDTLWGGFGDDSLTDSGADPGDWVAYNESGRSLGLTIDLSTNSATDGSETDEINSIENVMASDFDDSIVGDTANNYLMGLGGIDTLYGGVGADTLDAGGDSGDDVFYYDDCTTEGSATEKIFNFHTGDDEVHISKSGSGLGAGFTAGVQLVNGTNYELTASTGGAGASLGSEQFLYSWTDNILYYDDDGVSGGADAVAEFDPGMSDSPGPADILIVT